jgi:outer membrane receptor protein involved in Fe transport
MKKIGLVIISFIFLTATSFAQKGTLRGKIIDKGTGETLIGATIMVEGTTNGTISDFDGNYSLTLNPGTYKIRVSFVSYEKKLFEDIKIKPGKVTILNVNLGKSETQIGEVVVTARARQRTENAMQIMQKKSARLMDGISFEKISKLGDSNAAQALKRVTGVSVEGGKYVYVRGLSDRYTKITLNESSIPALDPEKNTVQMDIFPSNIIENIAINKTFTPDMPGESTGGHVNIITKDFPSKFTLKFSTSFGYNPQANLNDKFLTYPGGKTDWLGYDDGTRAIPDLAQDALDRMVEEDLGIIDEIQFPNSITDITKSFKPVMSPQEGYSFLDHGHKFSIGDQIKLFGKTLGYNAAISYSRDFNYYDDGINNMFEESVTPSPWKTLDQDSEGEEKVTAAGLLNLNYKLSNNNKIGVRLMKNQSGSKMARLQDGYFNYESTQNTIRNLAYLERGFNYYQLHGKHVIPSLNKSIINWSGSYTGMTQDEPDMRFFENLYEYDDNGNPEDWRMKTNDVPVRFYRKMNQTNIGGKIDIEIPFNIAENKYKFKFGGQYLEKERDMDNIKFSLTSYLTTIPNGDVKDYLENNIYTDDNMTGYYYMSDHVTNLRSSYQAGQSLKAFYGMFDMPLTDKLRVVTGARYEMSEVYSEDKHEDTEDYVKKEYNDLLPSLNITYSLIEDMNIRFAVSRTLARPKFREIGRGYYDYEIGYYIYGNPDLERSLINNLDLRWEYFFNRGEKVAVSGFYKKFIDPIEKKLVTGTQNYEIAPYNPDEAELFGIEVEFSKNLDFIPLMKNFSVGGNLTFTKSVVEIPEDLLENYILPADPDHEKTRPMQGQAPYIINAHLEYSNSKLGINSNMGFNITGEKLAIITKGRLPYAYEQPRALLNFNIAKTIKENYSVEFAVKNILNDPYERVHHFDSRDAYDQYYSTGRTFSVKFSYTLE